MPTDLTDVTEAPDFRMLSVIRAAMRRSQIPAAAPIELRPRKKKRRGVRKILREVARPFEQLFSKSKTYAELWAKFIPSAQAAKELPSGVRGRAAKAKIDP